MIGVCCECMYCKEIMAIYTDHIGQEHDIVFYECRKNSPKTENVERSCHWPRVGADDWCGDF